MQNIRLLSPVKLYDIAVELYIIDDVEVSETDFLNVLMSNNPKAIENNIVFTADNQVATFFLNSISILFGKLTHAQIVKSKSFIKKSGFPFSQTDLDTAKTRYEGKMKNAVYINIQKEINKINVKK